MFACCCNQCHTAPPDADEFQNVTKVDDYGIDEPDPAGIDPYSRPWNQIEDGSDCTLAADVHPAACGTPGKAVCFNHGFDNIATVGDPLREAVITGIKPCATSDVVTQIADNCYSKTGNKVSFKDPCKRKGWKGVQAMAVWPGAFGFTTSSVGCCPSGGMGNQTYPNLSHSETVSFHGASSAATSDYTADFSQTAIVDAFGNVTRTGHKHSYVKNTVLGTTTLEVTDNCHGSYHTGPAGYAMIDFTHLMAGLIIPGGPATIDASCGIITYEINGLDIHYSGTAEELNALKLFAAGTNTDTRDENGTGSTRTLTGYDPGTFNCTDTSVSLTFGGTATLKIYVEGDIVGVVTVTWGYAVSRALSGTPITWTSVMDDCLGLLGQWPLNNDAIYPWRTDGKTWLQPYVTRDAAAVQPTLNWTVDENCNFLNEHYYSGDIKGGPLPAGYGRHFDFRHIVWGKTNNFVGVCAGCELYLGELSAEPVPVAATVWTDRARGAAMYGIGAHVSQVTDSGAYSAGSPDMTPIKGVFMQKWAETLEAWPSVNFARACGRDRYLRNEAQVACIKEFTDPNLQIKTQPPVEFEVGDVVGMPAGIYAISGKTDAQHYTVGPKLANAPSEMSYEGVSKLRFQSARPICGILRVSAEQDDDNVSITVPEKHWLRNGDVVDFKKVDGLGSGLAVTVTGDNTFSVVGTLGLDYDGTGYVVSAGLTAEIWNWHSTCSRHEFLLREWHSQYREYAETHDEDPEIAPTTFGESSHTLAPTDTNPSVLVISPNAGDTFPNMFKQSWGNTCISPDMCYGQEWHMDFLQAVIDPFWQPDHEPCNHDTPPNPDADPPEPGENRPWGQAGAPCAEDEDHYQYPPLVEPRITKPDGAPEDFPVTLYYRDILYGGGPPPMPASVGTPLCGKANMEIPKDSPTIHSIRDAWEHCDDWKVRVNFKCPAPPISI